MIAVPHEVRGPSGGLDRVTGGRPGHACAGLKVVMKVSDGVHDCADRLHIDELVDTVAAT